MSSFNRCKYFKSGEYLYGVIEDLIVCTELPIIDDKPVYIYKSF